MLSVDACVEAFEAARAESGTAQLEAFVPRPGHPLYHEIVVELSRVDLEYAWDNGDRVTLDDYRRRFPEVFAVPSALSSLAFEEYRLRLQSGDIASPSRYARRYGIDVSGWPQPEPAGSWPEPATSWPEPAESWAKPVASWPETVASWSEPVESKMDNRDDSLSDRHHAAPPSDRRQGFVDAPEDTATELQTASSPSQLGCLLPGARFLGFEILDELGSGVHGRVFLARQPALAGRRVVLKITPRGTLEAERLASLQHGNVVPVYSVHSGSKLSAICMPYLGSTMLDHWVGLLRDSPPLPASGEAFLDRLAETHAGETDAAASGKSFPLLRRPGVAYCHLVLSVVGQLADGLAHAHRAGILHRDLKPANILLTSDGQPMLLDFHLALKLSGDHHEYASVGGTLPYMSPEQLASLLDGNSVCADPRGDLYSLGVILFELLTGRLPFETRRGNLAEIVDLAIAARGRVPSLREINPEVSPATEAIVRKCLEPDPRARYASAEQLAEDLRRQLADHPLRFASNPSIRERTAKWLRRHPRAASTSTLGILGAGLLMMALIGWNLQQRRVARLEAFRQFTDVQQPLREAIALLSVPLHDPLERSEAIADAESILARYGVFAEQPWTQLVPFAALERPQQEALQCGMGELLYLLASAHRQPVASNVGSQPDPESIRQAIRTSEKAIASYVSLTPPSALLQQHRDLLQQGGGPVTGPGSSLDRSAAGEPVSSDDRLFTASRLLVEGKLREALSLLRQCSQQSPQDFLVWFRLGMCHFALGQYVEAEGCFDSCLAISPASRQARYRRGMARLKRGHYSEARSDFDHLLAEDKDNVLARVCRGLAWRGEEQWQHAIDDFTGAVEFGFSQTRIYFLRSECYARAGDAERAEADRQRGMTLTPSDPLSWVARGVARMKEDPEGAAEDFRSAMELNPLEGEAYRNLAHVLSERLDRAGEAIAILDEMLGRISEDPYGWAGRAVLHARQQHVKEAHDDAERAIALSEKPMILYQVACVHALAPKDDSSTDQSLRLLARALGSDDALVLIAATDPDLRSLQSLEPFRKLVAAARILQLLGAELAAEPASESPAKN